MDDDIGDFKFMKRPALQKLCKQFGLKANGKNIDMIKSLEEFMSEKAVKEEDAKPEEGQEQPAAVAETSHSSIQVARVSSKKKLADVKPIKIYSKEELIEARASGELYPVSPVTLEILDSTSLVKVEEDKEEEDVGAGEEEGEVEEEEWATPPSSPKPGVTTRSRSKSKSKKQQGLPPEPPPTTPNPSSEALVVSPGSTLALPDTGSSRKRKRCSSSAASSYRTASSDSSSKRAKLDTDVTKKKKLAKEITRKFDTARRLCSSPVQLDLPTRVVKTQGPKKAAIFKAPKQEPPADFKSDNPQDKVPPFLSSGDGRPFSPPFSSDDLPFSPPSGDKRRSSNRRITFTFDSSQDPGAYSDSEMLLMTNTTQSSAVKKRRRSKSLDPGDNECEQDDVTTSKPQAKKCRRSTYEIPSHESSLLASGSTGPSMTTDTSATSGEIFGTKARRSTYDISSEDSSYRSSSQASSDGGSGGEEVGRRESQMSVEGVLKGEILSLLDQRVQERKADVNYKPQPSEFAAFSSRIPVKSASKRKFDKAHEKNFSRMKSIADYYTPGKEKKFAGVAKKKERRDSLTALARSSLKSVSHKKGDNRPSQNTAASSFKPTATNTKEASYAFSKDKTAPFARSTLKPRNTVQMKERRFLKPTFSSTSKAPKTPAHTSTRGEAQPGAKKTAAKKQTTFDAASVAKMPSATGNVPFVFTGAKKDEQNDPSTSVVANKRKTFDLQASLKRPKPKYKAYKGKVPKMSS